MRENRIFLRFLKIEVLRRSEADVGTRDVRKSFFQYGTEYGTEISFNTEYGTEYGNQKKYGIYGKRKTERKFYTVF